VVDDWIDVVLYYNTLGCVSASFFVKEANPAYVLHGTKGSLKHRGDIQEEELKAANKPNYD
jgi:hypothetical protein